MFVVGVDLGTQSLKAIVCDEGLVVRGQHAVAYDTQVLHPDHAEQDPRIWEAALGSAIAGALGRAGVTAADVVALAIAGQLDGCVAVDRNGAPVHAALIWQDRRAVEQARRADPRDVFAIAGQVADPSHLAPKICWLRDHGVRAVRFHQPTSYLVERLTGEAVIDPALASTTMVLDLATAAWSPPLLDAFGITPAELPAVRPTASIAGALTAAGARLTGLGAGTPVAVGTGDDFANPLGAGVTGVTGKGTIVCAIGTAEVVGAVAATLVLDRVGAEPMVETHLYPTGGFFVENPGWLSGGAVRWAIRAFGIRDEAELDALAAAAPPGAGGLTFIPALAGAMTPVWRPHARATFHGLAAGHDRTHLARAVLEGLTFACRDVVERLAAIGLPAREVLLVGGGARSRVWSQLRADTLGLPHHVAANLDACPFAAAMIATVAAGIHPDLVAAAAHAAPPTSSFEPGPRDTRDALDEAYRRYQSLVAQLAGP